MNQKTRIFIGFLPIADQGECIWGLLDVKVQLIGMIH